MRDIVWAPYWEVREIGFEDEAVVWLDVSKADSCWQRDNLYIPRGAPEHRGKYDRFGDWLDKSLCAVEMPHVSVGEGNSLSFSNGRHRFAWMRDHGAAALPVTIWTGQSRRLIKLAGTPLRVCQTQENPAG